MGIKKFIIVGAGFGGLAVAARLAHKGHKVTVLEKNNFVGGRCHPTQVNDCHFDAGPTLLMMLEPFRKLFKDLGTTFEEHIPITLCQPNYRVVFADNSQIDCSSNMAQMIRQIQSLSGEKDAAAFPKMIGELGELYHAAIPMFVRKNYDSPLQLIGAKKLQTALKHGMLGNLAKSMEGRFEDKRLQILFCLQTMYLGLSPKDAPSVYGVLTYMEYGEGIWYPKGGLNQIPLAVAKIAQEKGAEIRLNTEVRSIINNRVTLTTGEILEADAVICNGDLPYAEKELLTQKKIKKERRYSCSAYMMYIDYQGELPRLLHHNIVLGGDFDANLDQIFHKYEIPDSPAFYAAISSRAEKEIAPGGHENLFILVPCPNLSRDWSKDDELEIQEKVFKRLGADFGFDQAKIQGISTTSPQEWADEFNLDRGATFGLSHDFFQSVCFRPSNKSKNNKSLYFVGASTTPGNGLPMVLISAELVEQRLIADGIL